MLLLLILLMIVLVLWLIDLSLSSSSSSSHRLFILRNCVKTNNNQFTFMDSAFPMPLTSDLWPPKSDQFIVE